MQNADRLRDHIAIVCIAASISLIIVGYLVASISLLFLGAAGMLLSIFLLATIFEPCWQPALLALMSLLVIVRLRMSEFVLVVGDASAYSLDGIRLIERGISSGFFPPFSSAVAAVGYMLSGMHGIPFLNIIISLLSALLFYRLCIALLYDRGIAVIISTMLSLQPLVLWFSKTTFSETSWILIWLAALLALVLAERERSPFVPLAAFCVIAASLPFSRGSAPFLFLPMLAVALSIERLTSWDRLALLIGSTLPFLASLWWMLQIRAPYLIGWQFSRVKADITSVEILLGAMTIVGVASGLWIWLLRTYNRQLLIRLLISSLLVFKIVVAIALSPAEGSAKSILFGNELSMVLVFRH